jgi:hypothetical protein
MDAIAIVLILAATLLTVAVLVARIFFSHMICWPVLEAWAVREGVEIENDEVDMLFPDRGPFLFRALNAQRVYRLRVIQRGEARIAYARCGHWLLGLLKPTLSIRWKEEPNQTPATVFKKQG